MQNNFAALSSAQEPAQLIAQATSAAKNRRKKEKAKAKKAAANGQNQEQAPSSSEPSVPENNGSSTTATKAKPKKQAEPSDSLQSLQHQLNSESANPDCWGVWNEWTTRITSDKGEKKYKDRDGRRLTFSEALVSCGAVARSVGNCAHIQMMPDDRTQLEALLQACYTDNADASKAVSYVAFQVSQAMQGAPRDTQASAAAVLQSIVTRFQQAAELASDGRPVTDLSTVDEEIVRHMPVLHRAISQPDTVKATTINTGMHVAQLLRDKYEAEKHLSTGKVTSICLGAKSDAQQLASILGVHARDITPDTVSESRRDDSMISVLTARISALEAELTVCRADLQEALAAQGKPSNGRAAAANAASSTAAQDIVDHVESAVAAVARVPVGQPGNADDTLMQLMEHCRNCAQMQDKLMERLTRELDFARTRLLNASKMGSEGGVAAARELLSGVRVTSSEVHDAAARLEELVVSLDAHFGGSPSYSALRPMSMQVKHIAAQIYSAHNHLAARSWPDAILEEVATQNGKRGGGGGRNISMDEILRMNVGGKGAKAEVGAAPSADPMSRVATQGSTASTAGPPAGSRSPPQSRAGPPQVAKGTPVPPPHCAPPGMVAPPGYAVPPQMGGGSMGGMAGHPMQVVGGVHAQQPALVAGQMVHMVPMNAPDAAGEPPVQGVPVEQEAPPAATKRFGSSLAAAEEAAANLSRMLPPSRPPQAGRTGGRAGMRARRA